MIKKSIYINIFLLSIIISGCSNDNKVQDKSLMNYETIRLETGSIKLKETYISTLQPAVMIPLAFKVGGRILDMVADQGSIVSKNQSLATVDGEEINIGLNSSKNMIQTLEILKQSTQSMMDSQIYATQQKVDQAKIALDLANMNSGGEMINGGGIQLQQAQLGYQTTESEFSNTQDVLSEQEKTIYSNAKNALSQAKVFLEPLGVFVDELFGISDSKKTINDNFEIYLGAKNSSLKNQVEIKRYELNNKYGALISKINSLVDGDYLEPISQTDKDKIYTTISETENFLTEVRGLLKQTYEVLDASISSSTFSQTTIDQYKNYIVIYESNLEKLLLSVEGNYFVGIKGSRQAIDNFVKQSKMQLELLGKKQDIAKIQYQLAEQQLKAQENISKKQYEEAIAGLNAIKSQKKSQIDQINLQIQQVRGNLMQSQLQLKNTTLIAPFSGVILEKKSDLGQVVSPGMPIFFIGDQKQGKITIYVPEENISDIEKNDFVSIEILSIGLTLTGKVSTISPIAIVGSKRIGVDIVFPIEDRNIKFGMQTNVNILKKEISGYKIPKDYLIYDMGKPYIYVLGKNDITQKTDANLLGCEDETCIIKEFTGYNTIMKP